MRLSAMVGSRYKERPAEAVLESHAFLLRGGYARQVANGIYSLLPPGLRVARKIERIIREEMDRIGGQEILMPVVLPRELWEESGRYDAVGPELLRFKDRTGHDMLLGMTHEEAVVHLCRNEINSYAQLPIMVYQLQTKFRDEPRSRGGLIRVREFTMKDAYSFHTSQADLERYYVKCYQAYQRIFARAGVPEVAVVESDTGMMGGKVAHEYMLLTEAGEDTIVTCDTCGYLANMEVAMGRIEAYPEAPKPLEKVHTPNRKTIEEVAGFLGVEPRQTAKVVFYDADSEGKLVVLLIRGDLDVNESKLSKIIQAHPVAADEKRIEAAGSVAGFASPMSLDRTKIRVVVDHTIAASNNLVTGANEVDYHYKNFNLERDLPGVTTVDVANVREGDGCPQCGGKIVLKRGIEVGNIFQLGIKYTQSMGMTYLDDQGKSQTPIMGCYGIGVGRLVSSVMEARHDEYGPQWPMSIAPWHVHINALNYSKEPVKVAAEGLYRDLCAAGIEVLFDDRNERPGVQFADADLLGIPVRIIVSERNLGNAVFEYKRRDTGDKGTIPIEGAAETVGVWIREAVAAIDGAADCIAP
ncbi:MAG: prolyl-tRNA synthetase [Candidatus Hydrogenedentes bacterium]|nr:prolyl-tRNA synthetase [Candidatus Hydrogenedentota bacterium]